MQSAPREVRAFLGCPSNAETCHLQVQMNDIQNNDATQAPSPHSAPPRGVRAF